MLTLVIVERLLGVGLGRQGKAGQAWEGRGWLGRGGGDHLGDGEVEGGEDEDEDAEQGARGGAGLEGEVAGLAGLERRFAGSL